MWTHGLSASKVKGLGDKSTVWQTLSDLNFRICIPRGRAALRDDHVQGQAARGREPHRDEHGPARGREPLRPGHQDVHGPERGPYGTVIKIFLWEGKKNKTNKCMQIYYIYSF